MDSVDVGIITKSEYLKIFDMDLTELDARLEINLREGKVSKMTVCFLALAASGTLTSLSTSGTQEGPCLP